ncbi:SpoIIE family protein phosphatase [Streptomyces sp. NPDC089799]|uniref:SpoIIE family protein phosphatase n=1 Tax=Streptomyces sp. NPDC089799 TaxID=3155066 RepID=UPI00342BCFDD
MRPPVDGPPDDASVEERLDSALARVMRDSGASVGLVYLLVPEEGVLQLLLLAGASRQIAAPWYRVPADAPLPVADAVADGRLVWLGGGQEEVARRYPRLGIVLPYDFVLAAAPITAPAAVWGAIVVLWPVPHPPELGASEHEALDGFCHLAARLLQRAADGGRPLRDGGEPRAVRPPARTETDPALAAAALECAERLPLGCCSLDLDGRITFINTAGAALVGAEPARLLGEQPWEVLQWLRDPLAEDRYRAAVVSGRPTAFTAVRPPGIRLSFRLHPDASGISVQISPEEVAVGMPATTGTAPADATGPYGPQAPEPFGAMALYQLTHLAAALAEAVGVRDVARLVADQIVPAFGPQGLVLMTLDEGRLHIVEHRGYEREFLDRFDGTPVTSDVTNAQVLATGTPVFFRTYDHFRRAHATAPRFTGRQAWAFLPLTASGRSVGSLVLSYDRPRPFPPAERALLSSLAGLIAQALDRALLYDATHALAHTLQAGLLPHALPPVPGLAVAARYLAAGQGMDIGGDFYDLIHPGAGAGAGTAGTASTAVAVIGDVQGHNTSAAALMGQVRTAVHAHAIAGASPGAILSRTNRLLTELDPGLFTSCLIAELDLSEGLLRLASAGHPPPLLRSRDGHAEVLDVPPGLLLGIDADAGYPTTEVALPPGTVLALYTDGLVEIPGVDIGDSTADLLRYFAHADAATLDGLADGIIRHAEEATAHIDDMALLLLRRPGV